MGGKIPPPQADTNRDAATPQEQLPTARRVESLLPGTAGEQRGPEGAHPFPGVVLLSTLA